MKGVYTALITPFLKSGAIDIPAYKKILRDQADAGVAGVVPAGTTGEAPTLSIEEKKQLIETTILELKGTGLKIIAGTGSNDTSETVHLSKWASDAGVDGLLIVTPYYNRPSQTGLSAHFRAVADAVNCEVVLYNVPGRTGVSLTAATVAELASHAKIRTIKEASANVAFTSEIFDALRSAGKKMDVLSGDDMTYLPLLAVGASGVISVVSNLFPRAIVAMQKHAEAGNFAKARETHDRYFPLFRDLFLESNPVPVKFALSKMGYCEPSVRAPLVSLTSASAQKVLESLARCGLEKGVPA